VQVIPYAGDDSWVEGVLEAAHKCLQSTVPPPAGDDCDYCRYRAELSAHDRGR
jgi:hypothetical protein